MVLIFYIWIFAAPFLACSFSVDNYLNDKHRFIATKLLACSFECQRDILRAQLKIFHYKLIWINWVCLTYLKSWHWLSSIKPKSQIIAIFSRKSTIGLFLMCLTWLLSRSSNTNLCVKSSNLILSCYHMLLGSLMQLKISSKSKRKILKHSIRLGRFLLYIEPIKLH